MITNNSYVAAELRRITAGDALAKALLLVSRAQSKIAPDLTFSTAPTWPAPEPPEEADRIWAEFAERGPSGQNILERWRSQGRILVDALLAQLEFAP